MLASFLDYFWTMGEDFFFYKSSWEWIWHIFEKEQVNSDLLSDFRVNNKDSGFWLIGAVWEETMLTPSKAVISLEQL